MYLPQGYLPTGYAPDGYLPSVAGVGGIKCGGAATSSLFIPAKIQPMPKDGKQYHRCRLPGGSIIYTRWVRTKGAYVSAVVVCQSYTYYRFDP